ncbi:unnamed protein product [Adineta steineri]|uniref:Uncharacterized protein n=1 Tax=Adineta steineri TaxID=433720 RepID=A0A818T7S8_9BILA|nr:unnamed protein product [Adineta steineri]
MQSNEMTSTTWETTVPAKRGHRLCGPQSAFARLFPDRYRHQEELIRKQRSVSSENQRSNTDHFATRHTTSDDENDEVFHGHNNDPCRRSRRVRFYTNEINSPHIQTHSEPYLNQMHLASKYSENNLNYDPNPEIIYRDNLKDIVYTQKVGIRYLRPPTPPPPGPIVIREIQSKPLNDPPPLVVSATPPIPPRTPSPLIVREEPPTPPVYQPPRVITKTLPPLPTQPRRVVIKRKPPLPPKPRPVIIEKWLPYKASPERPILYQRAEKTEQSRQPPRNVILQYEPPRVHIKQKVQNFGCFRVDPEIYRAQHGSSLRRTDSIRRVLAQMGCDSDLISSTGYSTCYSSTGNQKTNFTHYDYPRQTTTCFTDEQLDALIGTAIPNTASQQTTTTTIATENHYDVPKIYNDNDDLNTRIASTV